MTDRYAVVGNPVAHSLSPRIHAAFASATGEAMVYERLLAPLNGFPATVEAFFAAGGAGLNVTVPFKQEAARWVDQLDPAALAAGAVNTIVATDGGYRGFNTDGPGLVRDLTVNCGLDLCGLRVLLLGAGGAARGVLRPLLEQGLERLLIVNRTASRAVELAAAVDSAGGRATGGGLEAATGTFDLVISATSAGLAGTAVAALPTEAARGAFCYDMVYAAPADVGDRSGAGTAFCRWADEHGATRVSDGLGMLVEQAALAFQLWRGVAPDTAPVLNAFRGGRSS
jgi:shikimate dehydrogenase